MAIIGKSVEEVRGLVQMGINMADLIQILQNPKALKSCIAELEGADEILAQKEEILKTKAKVEKAQAKNIEDVAYIERSKTDIGRMAGEIKDLQDANDKRSKDIDLKQKTQESKEKKFNQALADAENLKASWERKSNELDKLVSENKDKSLQLDNAITDYKTKLNILNQVG